MFNPMRKYLLTLLFALQSTMVFAETNIDKVLRDVNEAGRQAEYEVAKLNLSTKRGRLCYGHDGFTRDMIEARKNGIAQEELQLILFQQFNQNSMTIDVLKEMTTLLKGVYMIRDEIINDEEKLEQFLQNAYWFCMNSNSKK